MIVQNERALTMQDGDEIEDIIDRLIRKHFKSGYSVPSRDEHGHRVNAMYSRNCDDALRLAQMYTRGASILLYRDDLLWNCELSDDEWAVESTARTLPLAIARAVLWGLDNPAETS